MNKVTAILSTVAIIGCGSPDISWADRHVLAPSEGERHLLAQVGRDEFIGPVLSSESLSQRSEQPSWNWLSLTHTDTGHLPGSEQHHPAPYRNSQAPDGIALMFSWPFRNVSGFHQMGTQAAKKELNFNLDKTDRRPW